MTVFSSRKLQSEWCLTDTLCIFRRSASRAQAAKYFDTDKQNEKHIRTYHECLWPGEEFQLLRPKHGKGAESSKQESWLQTKTICTSGLFAAIAYWLNYKYMHDVDRSSACQGLSQLLACLLNCKGQCAFPHVKCGQQGRNPDRVSIELDASGRVMIQSFFSRNFWMESARALWKKDFKNSEKTWVNVMALFDEQRLVSLSDVVAFTLDPQHPREFQDVALPSVFRLLTEMAYEIDICVEDMSSTTTNFRSGQKRKRLTQAVSQAAVEMVANKIWSGDDARINLSLMFCTCSLTRRLVTAQSLIPVSP